MQNTRTLFLKHLAQTSPSPLMLEIVKAEGIYLQDVHGKSYADLISGISVSNVGHRHPHVLNAIHEQLEKYMHVMVYGEYMLSPQIKLAEKICSLLPDSLDSVYLVNSGAEATEGAMKLAKRVTGRSEIVCFENAYHGSTQGALSMIGSEDFRRNYRPLLPSIRRIRFNSIDQLSLITTSSAAVFFEPVQGEAGVVPAEKSFAEALRKRCTETGTLLVCDEIQTGFGRTGKMFAFENYNITPDILLLAKGMGGGLPIGAFVASKKHMSAFTENPVLGHITTFGGNPVCSAAALAVIEVVEKENLLKGIKEKEEIFRKHLQDLRQVKEFRSSGLLMAVQFESDEQNHRIIAKCIEKGIITDWFLFNSSSLRLAPPLTISTDECEKYASMLKKLIEEDQ